jgi:hypothetical protein
MVLQLELDTIHLTYDGANDSLKDSLGNQILRYTTGTYTGDGATSLAVTGVGFKPRYVRVWQRSTSDGTSITINETTDTIIDDNGSGMSAQIVSAATVEANTIISLDSDGFTVDDAGADAHPNTNGQVYNYLAIG